MIKQIILKDKGTIEGKTFKIDFSDKVNIIIGPKGGGKSTLFDLLASIKEGKIPKTVKDALAEYNLEFHKAIKFNNEEITPNSLSLISKKEKEKLFTQRNDVIFQGDPIKDNLNNASEIDKNKHQFAKEEVSNSESIRNIIQRIRDFYNKMKSFGRYNNTQINWNNTFSLKGNEKSAYNIILKINYDSQGTTDDIKIEKDKIEVLIKDTKEYIKKIERFSSLEWNKKLISKSFFKEKEDVIIGEKLKLYQMLKFLNKEVSNLKKIEIMVNSFNNAYRKIINEIKAKDFAQSGMKEFTISSKQHFEKIAKDTLELKKEFDSLYNEKVDIEFIDKIYKKDFLEFKMPNKIEYNDIDGILKTILHKPSRSQNDVYQWITNSFEKEFKGFDETKIYNKLGKDLKDDVQVFANGKNYNGMSLGERSIYGIKYKFNKSKEEDIFLDQPEDNLDNKTIADSILDLIKLKNKQVFIVTHNANIGILSKPKRVIIANIKDKKHVEPPYISREIKDSINFLEGGLKALEERYKILKG